MCKAVCALGLHLYANLILSILYYITPVFKIDECDALLVVGTSLEVFSAYRFVHRANVHGVKTAIVNFGPTRAEREKLECISFKSESNCAELLHSVANRLIS